MEGVIKCIRAECMKGRHTPLIFIHLLFPAAGALVFAGYFRISGWTEPENISVFLEAAAITFPFLIGIIVGIVVQLEKEAGQFLVMLGTIRQRTAVYIGKLLYLLLLAAVSTGLSLALFAVLYPLVPCSFYLKPAGVLLLTSLPVYLITMFLGLSMGKSAAMGIGIIGSLLSALMMTGLGDFIWRFIPWAWGIRLVEFCVLEYCNPERFIAMLPELKIGLFTMLTITAVLFVISLLWFNHWEGPEEEV